MTHAIELADVSRAFGTVVALDHVSLGILPGEFFALLGPSGSGKTTCLRLIAGFDQPDRGRILLDGEDVTDVPPYERNVNTVFQDYALFPHMTVADNVAFGLVSGARPRPSGAGAQARCSTSSPRLVRRPPAGAAVRRPEAAGRPGARADQPAEGAAARRAARRARPQAARGNAGGAEEPAAAPRHHLRLRHPRPG